MPEEKKDKWLTYLATTTVIFAVIATLSTARSNSFSTRAVLSQSMASNNWAQYQAKSIKSYLYELQIDRFNIEVSDRLSAESRKAFEERIAHYRSKIEQYNKDREDISKEAKANENNRDTARVHSQRFASALMFLQISILLSSIAALMKNKNIWYLSILIGVIGISLFSYGFMG